MKVMNQVTDRQTFPLMETEVEFTPDLFSPVELNPGVCNLLACFVWVGLNAVRAKLPDSGPLEKAGLRPLESELWSRSSLL